MLFMEASAMRATNVSAAFRLLVAEVMHQADTLASQVSKSASWSVNSSVLSRVARAAFTTYLLCTCSPRSRPPSNTSCASTWSGRAAPVEAAAPASEPPSRAKTEAKARGEMGRADTRDRPVATLRNSSPY